MSRLPIEHVVVVLPAHNEEDRIAATLSSVGRAADESPVPVSIVVVLDSCTDSTADRVRTFPGSPYSARVSTVVADVRRASSARQRGLDHYVGDFGTCAGGVPPNRVAVLSTDADTTVPCDWVNRHVTLLDAGFDAVAGVVELDSDDSGLERDRWWDEYRSGFTDDGGHPHVHCANLAVRLEQLMSAGGFGHARRAEDIDLWRRLGMLPDTSLLQTRESVVRTSSRRVGRVDGGFATALQQFQRPDPAVRARADSSS